MADANIIHILRDIQLYGPRSVSLSTVSFFDNTLEVQPPPQLQLEVYFKRRKKVTSLVPNQFMEEEEDSDTGGALLTKTNAISTRARASSQELPMPEAPQMEVRPKKPKRAKKDLMKLVSSATSEEPVVTSQSYWSREELNMPDEEAEELLPSQSQQPKKYWTKQWTSAPAVREGSSKSSVSAPVCPQNEMNASPKESLTLKEATLTIRFLEESVNSLKEERDYLRARLNQALTKEPATAAPVAPVPIKQENESDDSESDSSESESESSSASDSAKEQKRNRKGKGKLKKERGKGKKEKGWKRKMRVNTPDDAVQRYQRVLKEVKRGCSKAEAYSRLTVDRNTIVSQAPIAELAEANPSLYNTLKRSFKRKDSLKQFSEVCRGFCIQEPTATAITQKKSNGSLLDIYKN